MRRMLALSLVAALALVAGCGAVPPASTAQRARVHVTLYTTRWCPVCVRARDWLHDRGVRYQEHDVERDPHAALAHRRLNPSRTVPTADVEGTVLVGFVAEEWRSAIDSAAHRH
ncbi:MAG: glutaredoxin family protein [Sandaracinaceae bacterium]|nr:glutaredoxin family protein [Sandaracinaceae bacterium]